MFADSIVEFIMNKIIYLTKFSFQCWECAYSYEIRWWNVVIIKYVAIIEVNSFTDLLLSYVVTFCTLPRAGDKFGMPSLTNPEDELESI